MPPRESVRSRAVLLLVDDVDTDQIIPARFLTTTERRGLGTHLFADWRYAADGSARPDFALNDPANRSRQVLVVGRNFGCGSSREHAPWALADWGFRCIIAPSFADIFRNNALKNGIVPVQLDAAAHERVVDRLREAPDTDVIVDVVALRVTVGTESWPFPLAPFARHCLIEGIDQLGYLLGAADEITQYEAGHPATVSTMS